MIKVTGLTLLLFFVSSTMLFSNEYKKIIVLDKGVKRVITVSKTDEQSSIMSTPIKKNTLSKKGVIIAFKEGIKVDVEKLEIKYGLKFKKKLIIGYYIFYNVSNNSDEEIVLNIIDNEKNIKTVKPNWKKNNQPR